MKHFICGPEWVQLSETLQTNKWLFLSVCPLVCLCHSHTAVGQISLREKRTSTTPRSPVRPWMPAPLQLLPSRLWARPRPLISAGPPAVHLRARGSRSLRLTDPGPTPALGQAWASPVHSASQHQAASGRSTQSISIRWVQQCYFSLQQAKYYVMIDSLKILLTHLNCEKSAISTTSEKIKWKYRNISKMLCISIRKQNVKFYHYSFTSCLFS